MSRFDMCCRWKNGFWCGFFCGRFHKSTHFLRTVMYIVRFYASINHVNRSIWTKIHFRFHTFFRLYASYKIIAHSSYWKWADTSTIQVFCQHLRLETKFIFVKQSQKPEKRIAVQTITSLHFTLARGDAFIWRARYPCWSESKQNKQVIRLPNNGPLTIILLTVNYLIGCSLLEQLNMTAVYSDVQTVELRTYFATRSAAGWNAFYVVMKVSQLLMKKECEIRNL